MAIHDTGMFTVKEINRLKILQDVITSKVRAKSSAATLSRVLLRRTDTFREIGIDLHLFRSHQGLSGKAWQTNGIGDNNRTQAIPAGDGPSRRRRKHLMY